MNKLFLLVVLALLVVSGCVNFTTASIPAEPNPLKQSIPRLGTNDGTSIKF